MKEGNPMKNIYIVGIVKDNSTERGFAYTSCAFTTEQAAKDFCDKANENERKLNVPFDSHWNYVAIEMME